MEELRLAAKAYYQNSSKEVQNYAKQFFASMDLNGDDKISFKEFSLFLQQSGYTWVNPDMFSQLDADHSGSLDFWEVMTLYYIIKTRALVCVGCKAQLTGLYFTCVACFDQGQDTFDLCAKCYGGRKFQHHHCNFLDSFVLLRSKRGICPGLDVNLALSQPQTNDKAERVNQWFKKLDVAVGALKTVKDLGDALNGIENTDACNIM